MMKAKYKRNSSNECTYRQT